MLRSDRLTAAPIAVLVLLCALWGFQQVTVKLGVAGGFPPLLLAALRSAAATVLLALWIIARDGVASLRPMLSRAGLAPGLLIGVLFAGEFLLLFPGLTLTTASRGVLFLYTAPFFTALGAHLFVPGERLRARQGLGLLIAFAGLVAAFADGLRGGGSLLGDAMCLGSGMMWAAVTVLVKASKALRTVPATHLLLFQVAASAPVLLAASVLWGDLAVPLHISAIAWLCFAYQAVIVTFASYLTWFWLVTRYQAAAVSGFTFLAPLFGIAAGAAMLGEHASPALLLGVVGVAVGMRYLR
jgi:drug/metabolite transporter (DMT)-like permease